MPGLDRGWSGRDLHATAHLTVGSIRRLKNPIHDALWRMGIAGRSVGRRIIDSTTLNWLVSLDKLWGALGRWSDVALL